MSHSPWQRGERGGSANTPASQPQTSDGRRQVTLPEKRAGHLFRPEDGHLKDTPENRKLLVFPLAEVPELGRGRGVILQKHKDGGLADVRVFTLASGLTWRLGDRERTEADLRDWLGTRAQSGRLPPHGFPKVPKFG